jgi:hypothetical protein
LVEQPSGYCDTAVTVLTRNNGAVGAGAAVVVVARAVVVEREAVVEGTTVVVDPPAEAAVVVGSATVVDGSGATDVEGEVLDDTSVDDASGLLLHPASARTAITATDRPAVRNLFLIPSSPRSFCSTCDNPREEPPPCEGLSSTDHLQIGTVDRGPGP